jgi:hypothetical protein
MTFGLLSEGTLVQVGEDIYVREGLEYHHIPDPETFAARGYSMDDVYRVVSPECWHQWISEGHLSVGSPLPSA